MVLLAEQKAISLVDSHRIITIETMKTGSKFNPKCNFNFKTFRRQWLINITAFRKFLCRLIIAHTFPNYSKMSFWMYNF